MDKIHIRYYYQLPGMYFTIVYLIDTDIDKIEIDSYGRLIIIT